MRFVWQVSLAHHLNFSGRFVGYVTVHSVAFADYLLRQS